MKALVVDDTKNDRLLLTKIISSIGYQVESASNGAEALEKIRKEKPDFIISDILMPEMDGFRLCRELKNNDGTKEIPLIFYTATYTDPEDEKLGMLEGAAGFIRKPVEPLKLVEMIRSALLKHRTGTCAKAEPVITDDREYYSLYSQRLLNKLENKAIELENTRNKLESAFEELITLDRHKDNILSNVTHELRTPLTHAIGFLELAMSETDETRRDACLEKCRGALFRENKVITRLIETANLEKGHIRPVIEIMDVGSMIKETIQALMPNAIACGIDISSEIGADLFAKGDKILTKHMLANLLDNAIKFNRNGGKVDISAYRKNENIEICFSDTGIGIPRDKIDKIFDKMYQVDSDSTRRYGGIGIGLSTAKSIVEAHRGRIWVESKAGMESKFFITIPQEL